MVYVIFIITASYSYERSIPCRKFSIFQVKLARNLISNKCVKVLRIIHQIVISPDITARYRQLQEDFTCKRKLPVHVLIVFLINFVRDSYQDELDGFFKTICRFDVAKRMVSKAVLSSGMAEKIIELPPFCHFGGSMPADFSKNHGTDQAWKEIHANA